MSAPRLITYQGESCTMREWAAKLGILKRTLRERLKRMTVEEALTFDGRPGRHGRRKSTAEREWLDAEAMARLR
jgi:hypothetical protein